MRQARAGLIGRLGEGTYKGLYSAVALVGIVLISIGYGQYRAAGYIPVWTPPVWTQHLNLLLMVIAFILLAAAYLPGHIKARTKHPMLAAVKIWAFGHLLANGDLGSILLFGSFLAWAVLARISAKRRDPVRDHAGPVAAPAGWRNDAIAVAVGLGAYVLFAFYLHPVLIGVPVISR